MGRGAGGAVDATVPRPIDELCSTSIERTLDLLTTAKKTPSINNLNNQITYS